MNESIQKINQIKKDSTLSAKEKEANAGFFGSCMMIGIATVVLISIVDNFHATCGILVISFVAALCLWSRNANKIKMLRSVYAACRDTK